MATKFSKKKQVMKPPPVCKPCRKGGTPSDCFYDPLMIMFGIASWNTWPGGVQFKFQVQFPKMENPSSAWIQTVVVVVPTTAGDIGVMAQLAAFATADPCVLRCTSSFLSIGPAYQAFVEWLVTTKGTLPFFCDSNLLPTDPVPGYGRAVISS